MNLSDVLEFVRGQSLAVVATSDVSGKPEAAVVEFAEFDDLTIIIDTLNTSRKYTNLQANKNVALVIGWDNDVTVQIDAVAEQLSGDKLARAKETYFAKNPRARKWEDRPGVAYFAFYPRWIKYSDVGQTPWLIQEFTIPDGQS